MWNSSEFFNLLIMDESSKKKIMLRLSRTEMEELILFQQKKVEVNEALKKLSAMKEMDYTIFQTEMTDLTTVSLSFERIEYIENHLIQFPTCNLLGKEGFLGINKDDKPVYEINTRIDELARKSFKIGTQLTYLNSIERQHIWKTFLNDYHENPNIIFIFSSKVFDSIFESEENRLNKLLSSYQIIVDEMIDIIVCENEMHQYEDFKEEIKQEKEMEDEMFSLMIKTYVSDGYDW